MTIFQTGLFVVFVGLAILGFTSNLLKTKPHRRKKDEELLNKLFHEKGPGKVPDYYQVDDWIYRFGWIAVWIGAAIAIVGFITR